MSRDFANHEVKSLFPRVLLYLRMSFEVIPGGGHGAMVAQYFLLKGTAPISSSYGFGRILSLRFFWRQCETLIE
jgi:hypothetical protein